MTFLKDYKIETTKKFSELGLDQRLVEQLNKIGFESISEIQELTLAPILDGKDIFAQAETGSGKTGAFVIPMIEQIMRDNDSDEIYAKEAHYVILSPTRELAQQTHSIIEKIGYDLGVDSCCVIGGESIEKQKEKLDNGVHVVVATPGRLVDLVKQEAVFIDFCNSVVFDEADRLFDMGFKKDIEFLLGKVKDNRQLVMLSATSNQDVLGTAYKFGSLPEELRLNVDSLLVENIDHKLAMITREEKFPLLVNILRKEEDPYAIVFCNTQMQTHTVAEWLKMMDFKAMPISGKLAQGKRTQLIKDFREKKTTILVCTDVAARGLDIKNVQLVINYDLPQEAANYVHRIGRTGRAGEKGHAISFCAHEDCEYLDPITKLVEDEIEKIEITEADFAKDICRKPFIERKTLKVRPSKYADRDKKPRRQEIPAVDISSFKELIMKSGIEHTNSSAAKHIELSTHDLPSSKKTAMKSLNIEDNVLLGHDLVKKGSKRFIFFGARKNKYKFFVKPIYKRILLPFLIKTLKNAGLNLYIKISYRPDSLMVSFSGKDQDALLSNNGELLKFLDKVIRDYLASKIEIPSSLKIQVKSFIQRDNAGKGGRQGDRNGKPGGKPKSNFDEGKLRNLAKKMREKVISSKASVKLKPLNAKERRIIHQYFQDDKEITSSSIGEGRFKNIELSFK